MKSKSTRKFKAIQALHASACKLSMVHFKSLKEKRAYEKAYRDYLEEKKKWFKNTEPE